MFYGIVWFVLIASVAIIVWRYREADKKAREERQRKYGDRNK